MIAIIGAIVPIYLSIYGLALWARDVEREMRF